MVCTVVGLTNTHSDICTYRGASHRHGGPGIGHTGTGNQRRRWQLQIFLHVRTGHDVRVQIRAEAAAGSRGSLLQMLPPDMGQGTDG